MNDDDNPALPLQDATADAGSGRLAESTETSKQTLTNGQSSPRRLEGWIPPPPKGRPHIPWDLYQTLMKACHRDELPPRKDTLLPYLVIRAFPGDRGGRPLPDGTIWWESPDIFVLPNQSAATAPDLPPNPNGQLTPNVPNTIYAHVWNLGRGPVINARVEFYWSGELPTNQVVPIGLTHVTLGPRTSPTCHTVVHCPVDFFPDPQWHVGLLVRVSCPFLDPVDPAEFDASKNRHVGLRFMLSLLSPRRDGEQGISLTLRVTASQGTRRSELVTVQPRPDQVPWIQLLTGQRDHGRRPPAVAPTVGITLPRAARGRGEAGFKLGGIIDDALGRRLAQKREFRPSAEPVQVNLVARAPDMTAEEVLIVRVQQRDDGKLVGGFTGILLP